MKSHGTCNEKCSALMNIAYELALRKHLTDITCELSLYTHFTNVAYELSLHIHLTRDLIVCVVTSVEHLRRVTHMQYGSYI